MRVDSKTPLHIPSSFYGPVDYLFPIKYVSCNRAACMHAYLENDSRTIHTRCLSEQMRRDPTLKLL